MPTTAPVRADVLADWLLESLENMTEAERATKQVASQKVLKAITAIFDTRFPNMNNVEVAAEINSSSTAVGDVRKGKLPARGDVGKKIATAAGYVYSELRKGNLVKIPSQSARVDELDPEAVQMLLDIQRRGKMKKAKTLLSTLDDTDG